MIIVKHSELSTFKYISNYMLIYVKILNYPLLKYFVYEHLNAHSIYPINIFKIRSKLCILELNIVFWHLVNKPSWCRELHMQQGKHTTNLQYIHHFFFFTSCVQTCSHPFCRTSNFKLFDVP